MKPKRRNSKKVQFAICMDNRGYEESLERGRAYRTVTDREANALQFLRIIDESGEDYLFPAKMFKPIRRRKMPG